MQDVREVDKAVLLAQSEQELQEMESEFNQVCKRRNLMISVKKE